MLVQVMQQAHECCAFLHDCAANHLNSDLTELSAHLHTYPVMHRGLFASSVFLQDSPSLCKLSIQPQTRGSQH